jgi:hypothetical protein
MQLIIPYQLTNGWGYVYLKKAFITGITGQDGSYLTEFMEE